MKYEFKNVGLDEYEIHYKNDKVIKFKKTIEMASKLQGIDAKARLKMYKELTSQGITKEDLIIKKIENGKTIYDETNYKEFEKNYLYTAMLETINEIYVMCFNMGFMDIINELELKENEIELFSKEFTMIISGKDKEKFPSKEETK